MFSNDVFFFKQKDDVIKKLSQDLQDSIKTKTSLDEELKAKDMLLKKV